MEALHTDQAPQAIGPYSQAILADGFLFASGQIPIDPATGSLVEGDITVQTRQVAKNIQAVLAAAGMDFSNVVAEQHSNEKFHWIVEATDAKNVYQVGFVNEEDWGQFWEVNIKEKTVVFINTKEYMLREYGHSRLDKDAPFEIADVTADTLMLSGKGVSYKIQGKVVNHTGKTISYANMSGSLKVIFENKTEEVSNSYSKNHKVLKKEVSESHPWKDGEAIDFTVITQEIKQIYLDYDPQYVFFTIEMSAGDPIGYSYNKAIYEEDMKERWNAIRK